MSGKISPLEKSTTTASAIRPKNKFEFLPSGYSASILAHLGPGFVAEPHWPHVSIAFSDSFRDEVKRVLEWGKDTDFGVEDMEGETRLEYLAMLKKATI